MKYLFCFEKFIQDGGQIKDGVDYVFESNPKLAEIGTKEQYSQYLDTVFPESQLKDIVYHGGRIGIEKFRKRNDAEYKKARFSEVTKNGIYFTGKRKDAEFYIRKWGLFGIKKDFKIYSVLLNIRNQYVAKNIREVSTIDDEKYDYLKKNNYDGVTFSNNYEIVVFEPDQIHILGSKEDIDGFKFFVER